MHQFTDPEKHFLDCDGAYLRLATLHANGAPHLTVMWFRREADRILMITPLDSQKVRNLRHDTRFSALIEDPETPQRYLELRGTAEIIDDDQRAREELFRIARRYIGDDRAQAYVQGLSPAPRVILALDTETIFNRNALEDA